jgi:hypothetical protein
MPHAALPGFLLDVQHANAMVWRLVAHHSCVIIEAGERGLGNILVVKFEPAPYLLSSALTCCDMTTSPDGEPVPADTRLAEVQHRYSSGHLVSRSISAATPMILRAVEEVHGRAAPSAQVRRGNAHRAESPLAWIAPASSRGRPHRQGPRHHPHQRSHWARQPSR